MQRLNEIKKRLETIDRALNEQGDRFRDDPVIKTQIRDLKDYVDAERKKIQRQETNGELTDFEAKFILGAIDDVYTASLSQIRRGASINVELSDKINNTLYSLNYWLSEINGHTKKKSE
ncbi:hypothetical protein ABLV08_12835 [Klebsiella sp. CN_Kp088]|uniref:hypothetical protein n=1 Tax=Klebsiella sp. CN_Kp088 TaxID=3153415 RepID=UPI002294B289|nr:hypothetical protein [Klebsiella aerogenes]